MPDLALDPLTGDLAISAGMTRLTAEGAETTRQRLQIRLGLWQGEYSPDTRIGIPYTKLLGAKGAGVRRSGPSILEQTLRQATVTCPGIASVGAFRFTYDPATRGARVTIQATSVSGEPVTLTDFLVGAVNPASP